MKMRVSSRVWQTICAFIFCVNLKILRADRLDMNDWTSFDMKTVETRQDFKKSIDDETSREAGFPMKLIPIKESRVDRNHVMYKIPLEPDAEMLPAHYTGVKSPGVDHMELRYAESQISKVVPKMEMVKKDAGGDERHMSKEQQFQRVDDRKSYEKSASFEKGQRGEDLRQNEKTGYVEAGGKKKVHEDRRKSSNYKAAHGGGNGGGNYKKEGKDQVERKSMGYRNVYHKDEYKKDHDYYDNDDHGGHSKKHGRYNEKHVATEGKFKKGATVDSGFEDGELRKKGVSGNSQVDGESKGHEARSGYDGFVKNFQGFAMQAGKDQGKGSGFGQGNIR